MPIPPPAPPSAGQRQGALPALPPQPVRARLLLLAHGQPEGRPQHLRD